MAPMLWLVGCAVLASLSLGVSAVPHYDPFAWLVWGLELTHLDVGLSTLTGPSWKPFPVLVAIPSVLGTAAPAGWLVLARTGGLLALVFAYRLGKRFGSGAAGVLAVVAIVLIPGLARELMLGGELSLLVVLVLATVDRHCAGRPGQAMGLGFAAALLRSEVWPFLGLYCLWAWRTRSVDRRVVAGCCLVVPALWFLPDWITLGDPLHGSAVAKASTEARTQAMIDRPVLEVAVRAYRLVPVPLHLLAVAAVGVALRRRDRRIVVLAGAALGWRWLRWMAAVGGYPGSRASWSRRQRWPASSGRSGRPESWAWPGAGRLPVAGLLLVTLVVSAVPRWHLVVDQVDSPRAWGRVGRDLHGAVRLATAAVPAAIGWYASAIGSAWVFRYLAVIVPPILLLAAVGIGHGGRPALAALAVAVFLTAPIGGKGPPHAKSNLRGVAQEAGSRLRPGDLVISPVGEVPLLAHYLPAGVGFAATSGPVGDVHIADWRDIAERLRQNDPRTTVPRTIDMLPPGGQLLVVCPSSARTDPGHTAFTELNFRRCDEVRRAWPTRGADWRWW